MTLALFTEQILNGLVLGSIYALLGSGLALVYGTTRLLNLAHGEFFMLGGYFLFLGVVVYGINPFLAVLLAILAAAAIGALVQRVTLHYIMSQEGWTFSSIALTLGLSIMLQNAAFHLWGERYQSVPYFVEGVLALGDIRLPLQRVLIFMVALTTMGAVAVFLKFSRFGTAVRAVAQDSEAAAVLGIPAMIVHTATFALGAALAAVAATMLAPVYAVNPWMGAPVMLKAFVVVVLGGLGSFKGAIVGGLLLGVVESIGITLTSSEWRDVISFSVLMLVLWLRPWGLFGQKA